MASLDRVAVCAAIKALFEADSTLYGSGKLINYITADVVKFETARVGVDKSYKMFLKATSREKIAARMGNNADYAITVLYRIEGLQSNPQTAYQNIDDVDERIDYLCDNEMWTGNNLSDHFVNAECTVINIEFQGSDCDVRIDDGGCKVECEGSIRVEINRIKP